MNVESLLVRKHFIEEPCPANLRNNYFSHRCKFQVFPTNGVDLLDAGKFNSYHKTRFFLEEVCKQLTR